MTLKEFQDKIKGKYEVSKITTNISYVIKLGSSGCVTIQYTNNELKNIIIDGKEKEELEKLLKTLDK